MRLNNAICLMGAAHDDKDAPTCICGVQLVFVGAVRWLQLSESTQKMFIGQPIAAVSPQACPTA